MTKRRVMTYEWRWDGKEYAIVEAGEGRFVQYGTDFIGADDGFDQVKTGCGELSDRRERNYPLHLIRFLEEEEEDK